ncbi:MAG: tRNA modification GTPase [Planctomycetota bacterium]
MASPPGPAARGILRISGPAAFAAVGARLGAPIERERRAFDAVIDVLGFPVAVLVLTMPGPRSFTGEDVVELHLPGSPLLLELVGQALGAKVRLAHPGEFSRRAFDNGKLDLARAEAIAMLIAASGADEHRTALALLRGELGARIDQLRARILDARALLEAGLDFEASETGAVPTAEVHAILAAAQRTLAELRGQFQVRQTLGDVLVFGYANAGKSALVNALAGCERVLVADIAGTTRDVLEVELGDGLRLLDTPGELEAASGDDARALALRDELSKGVGATLLVVDPRVPRLPSSDHLPPLCAIVSSHADLAPPAAAAMALASMREIPLFAVDSLSGRGIDRLLAWFSGRARPGGGHGARIAGILERAQAAVVGAIGPLSSEHTELAALELGAAIEALGEIDGKAVGDAVLDRIFGSFCLGK